MGRARYYHPGLKRFISEDPFRVRNALTTLYVYARNNPLRIADPLGLFEVNILGGFGFGALFDKFGGEASAGAALTVKGSSMTDVSAALKRFTSVGKPVGGINFSGDVFGGILFGELAGRTTNVNISIGPASLSGFFDPETWNLLGFTAGPGPTLPCPPCLGVSVTESEPCIRGLRITVTDVLEYLASGMSEDEILRDFPDLTREDIRACLAFAADRERKFVSVPPA